MKLQQIPNRIANKLSNYTFQLFGIDRISGAKVKTRDDLEELGTEYGGWVIPVNLLDSNSICYCVGCGEDISFDLSLIDRFGCDVCAFDPTPRAIQHVQEVAGDIPQYRFFELGLWDKEDQLKFYVPQDSSHVSHSLLNLQQTKDYICVPVNRLSNIMQEMGHAKIDLLKIDIEGAEYKVIESILEDQIEIKIICIEYDECFNPLDQNFQARIKASVNSLLACGYSLVCAQGNGNYTFVKDV
ncbi:MAG: FkbM family methyltransferase [Pleurocapsa sp.]